MLNKSMLIKLLVFAMILVGCANSDIATEKMKVQKFRKKKWLRMIHQQ